MPADGRICLQTGPKIAGAQLEQRENASDKMRNIHSGESQRLKGNNTSKESSLIRSILDQVILIFPWLSLTLK